MDIAHAPLPTDPGIDLPSRPEGVSAKCRQVLDAAERLFLAQGYGAVSMDVVARTAGVSKATLYAHFASKDQLFATIVSERGMPLVLDDAAYPNEVQDMHAALTVVGAKMLRFMLRERIVRIYRIAIAESARFPELGQAFHDNGPQRTYARLEAWLRQQQAAGLVAMADPNLAAQQFVSLLRSGLFLRVTLNVGPKPSEAEMDATVAAAVSTWMAAFGRPRASQPA